MGKADHAHGDCAALLVQRLLCGRVLGQCTQEANKVTAGGGNCGGSAAPRAGFCALLGPAGEYALEGGKAWAPPGDNQVQAVRSLAFKGSSGCSLL